MSTGSTDTNPGAKFSGHVLLTLCAKVAAAAATMLTGVVLARRLGTEGVATYALLTVTVSSIVQVLGSGLTAANIYRLSSDKSLLPRITANSLAFSVICGTLASLAIVLVILEVPQLLPNVPQRLWLIALSVTPFQLWFLFGLGLLLALGSVREFNIFETALQFSMLLGAAVILLIFSGSLESLIVVNVFISALLAILLFTRVWDRPEFENGSEITFYWRLFKEMIRFGFRINVTNAALALVLRSDLILVNYLAGQTAAGVYAIATQYSLLVIMFPNIVGTLLLPNVAGMTEGSVEFTATIARRALIVLLVLAAIAMPLAFLLPVIYGPAFAGASTDFMILLPGAIMLGLQMILSQHLVGRGAVKPLPYFWLATLALSMSLNLFLIPILADVGAAIVSTVSYGACFLMTLLYFRKHSGCDLLSLFVPRSGDLRAIVTRTT
jgi:O-antigen/teichoic acid export membrane protein